VKKYTKADIDRIMPEFYEAERLYLVNGFDKLSPSEIQSWQHRLSFVLELFMHSLESYPPQGALHLNKLGAVLIRLSFIKWENRHEKKEEFEKLIQNYVVKEKTLQVKIEDLI